MIQWDFGLLGCRILGIIFGSDDMHRSDAAWHTKPVTNNHQEETNMSKNDFNQNDKQNQNFKNSTNNANQSQDKMNDCTNSTNNNQKDNQNKNQKNNY